MPDPEPQGRAGAEEPSRRPSFASRNLWGLVILCFLEERPMHPYEMQRLANERHKDEQLGLRPGSIYRSIEQLVRDGLIVSSDVGQQGRRPERTVYRLTAAGEDFATEWLRALLREATREPSRFLGGLSFLSRLTPEEGRARLRERADAISAVIARIDGVIAFLSDGAGRMAWIELDYERAVWVAERDWVQKTIARIDDGSLAWRRTDVVRVETDREPASGKLDAGP